MYGVFEARREIEKCVAPSNVLTKEEIAELADMMLYGGNEVESVLNFLWRADRLTYVQFDELYTIYQLCDKVKE